jgi:predicted MFS family arabinose efflux permease
VASNAAAAFAGSLSTVALVWLVRGDPGAIGLLFALRAGALLVFGIPAGLLADRMDRRTMLILGNVLAIGISLGVAGVASTTSLPQWAILVIALAFGILDAGKIASAQSYAFDLVGPLLATSGIAIAAIGFQLASALGNLMAGPLMDSYGVSVAFVVVACGIGVSTLLLLVKAPSAEVRRRLAMPDPEHVPQTVRTSLHLVRHNHVLALLALVVIVTEIFGFSSMVLLPVFANQVFHTDAAGYGAMGAVMRLGGAAALVILAVYGTRLTRASVLLTTSAIFGSALMLLALSPVLAIAFLPIFVAGGAAAVSDSLSQSLMQRSTAPGERGAAMGVWAFGVGCGPFGHVAVGLAAARVGAPVTQLVSGGVLLLLAIALSFNRGLRRLR